jgi:hypothetical protein
MFLFPYVIYAKNYNTTVGKTYNSGSIVPILCTGSSCELSLIFGDIGGMLSKSLIIAINAFSTLVESLADVSIYGILNESAYF